MILDTTGKVVLKTLTVDCGLYLATTIYRIYFAIKRDHTVHCISFTGEEIWVHQEDSLINPDGITVDGDQNVFVAVEASNSLIVIQHDGKSSKTLLSTTDGLTGPTALHYNKDTKLLLLCNKHGPAALYTVE